MSTNPPQPPLPPPSPPSPPPYTDNSPSSIARIIRTTLSYDTNVMLSAIISLLLVILFVLLLHLYTRWFLVQARRRNRSSVTFPHVLRSRLHHRFTIIESETSPTKSGLPYSLISSLPLFVYHIDQDKQDYGLECAICLSLFEQEEIGRKLPDCGHAFHVECIDMWLNSHSTCPICRSLIQCSSNRYARKIDQVEIEITDSNESAIDNVNEEELRLEIVDIVSDQISEVTFNVTSEISNKSCSSRSGGKVHPSSNVNDDESEV